MAQSQVPTATLSPTANFEVVFAKPVSQQAAPVGQAAFTQPVQGEVIDWFRPPAHIGAPGNRGWEYSTSPGDQVVAAQDGTVHFAGQIAGDSYISINHTGGIRTTYSHVTDIQVAKSQTVTRGQLLARTAQETFHFGVRQANENGDYDEYIDPATLLSCQSTPAGPSAVLPVPPPAGQPADQPADQPAVSPLSELTDCAPPLEPRKVRLAPMAYR